MLISNCSSACEVFFSTVFPVLGCIFATLIALSPLHQVRKVLEQRNLDSLNTLPFSLLFLNNLSWILYSYSTTNIFIFASNIIGLVLCLYYSLSCFPYETDKNRVLITRLNAFGVGLLISLGALSFIIFKDRNVIQQLILGYASVTIVLIFYASPLSTILTVIKTKSSKTLHMPLALTCLMNAILWFLYGLFLQDYFVALPNGFGGACAVVQLGLGWGYPKDPKDNDRDVPDSPGSTSSIAVFVE